MSCVLDQMLAGWVSARAAPAAIHRSGLSGVFPAPSSANHAAAATVISHKVTHKHSFSALARPVKAAAVESAPGMFVRCHASEYTAALGNAFLNHLYGSHS